MKQTKTYQKSVARKYGWISLIAVAVLVIVGFLSQSVRIDQDSIHGVSEEGQFALTSFIHGNTLELSWEEIPGASRYLVYFSETNPLLGRDNSLELTTVGSTSLSLTPYQDGYYRVVIDGQIQGLESHSLEVRRR